ncbi:ribonuclease P protein component [Desulfitobacterium sp.]|uniref:ribonuclease P protein component n=1 Tax=Desulfitobacterium sp. TaxID=49981 RepID=UPI002CE229F5|nr:ribonuclease P protein component [Desulfitobacterium sp.]HVJ49109.1 ribonuclease P protein component [Desulfitobacterium sp.]
MLARNLRLRHKKDYKTVFAQGKSFSNRYVVFYIMEGTSKYGFIASKKVGNAVQRNRAKRLMREVIRRNLSQLKPNLEIICIARANLKGVSYGEVENSCLNTLKKARVIN